MTPPILGIWASQISGHLWAPSGSYDALATVTVPSGGSASVTFAGIPTGYKHLQIRSYYKTSTGGTSRFIVNGDSTGGNYANHILYGDGSSAASVGFPNAGNILPAYAESNTTAPAVWICDLLDYANTSKNKTIRSLFGTDVNGAGGIVGLASGVWLNTSAINTITISTQSGTFAEYSSFALYGVK